MVDVGNRPCGHEGCNKQPNFGVEGSKAALYCKQHAGDGMVMVTWRHANPDASHDKGTSIVTFGPEVDSPYSTMWSNRKGNQSEGLGTVSCGKRLRSRSSAMATCTDYAETRRGYEDYVHGIKRIRQTAWNFPMASDKARVSGTEHGHGSI